MPAAPRVLMISKAMVAEAYHGRLEALAGLGVELTLVIPRRWGATRAERTEAAGYRIRALRAPLHGRNHFHFYLGLGSLIHRGAFDLVHIDEEPYSLVTCQALRLARRAGIASLFFAWQNIRKEFPPPFRWTERYCLDRADGAIAGNEEAGTVLRSKRFSRPMAVVPQMGVDSDTFSRADAGRFRAELGLPAGEPVIGLVARMIEEKGGLDLLEAAARIAPPLRPHILAVGSGPLESGFRRRAAELGLADRLVMVARVSDMPAGLNCMDCLVLPSRTRPNWKEQFGRVLVEAMACEVPVIGSSSGEIPRVIGDAGRVFPEGDAGALARELELLLGDRGLAAALGRRGRERVLRLYTHRRIAADTAAFYRTLLGG